MDQKKKFMRQGGIEPPSQPWEGWIIATRPLALFLRQADACWIVGRGTAIPAIQWMEQMEQMDRCCYYSRLPCSVFAPVVTQMRGRVGVGADTIAALSCTCLL